MANANKNDFKNARRKFDETKVSKRTQREPPKAVFVRGAKVSPKRAPE